MKVKKWIELSEQAEIEISAEDIRVAMVESFEEATRDTLGEHIDKRAVPRALNNIGAFFSALTDDHIASLTLQVRKIVADCLSKHAERFEPGRKRG